MKLNGYPPEKFSHQKLNFLLQRMAAYALPHAQATSMGGNTVTYTPTGSLASTMFSTSATLGKGLLAWERSFLEGKQFIQKSDYWTVPQELPESWTNRASQF